MYSCQISSIMIIHLHVVKRSWHYVDSHTFFDNNYITWMKITLRDFLIKYMFGLKSFCFEVIWNIHSNVDIIKKLLFLNVIRIWIDIKNKTIPKWLHQLKPKLIISTNYTKLLLIMYPYHFESCKLLQHNKTCLTCFCLFYFR